MELYLDIYRRVLAGESLAASLSPRALWKLTGPDAVRYLNGQVTCDVTRIEESRSSYAAVCTAKGRMDGDVTIALHKGEFYLDAPNELRESLGARLDKYLIADDAVFEDISESWMLSHHFGATAPNAPSDGFIVKNHRFELPGFDAWTPVGPGLSAPVDESILDTLRIERGIGKWGAELTANTLPPEAGPHMLAAISYTKGCYVGQETIARLKSVGHVNKTLVFLRSATEQFPAPGTKLIHDAKEAGTVTSSAFSPHLQRGIALAYVQRQLATNGAEFLADGLTLTIAPSVAEAKP